MTDSKSDMDTIFVTTNGTGPTTTTTTTTTSTTTVNSGPSTTSIAGTSSTTVGGGTASQQDHHSTSVVTSVAGTTTAAGTTTTATGAATPAPQVITEANSMLQLNGTNGPGPGLQKIVLEDIKLEDYYNETMEESLCKQFKFQITNNELKAMIENSVLETNTAKPYRYLTGNFIRVFERHVEVFEKQRIPIQKRNNVVYEESLRNNTVYMRVNGDCKLCPKANRVRYVFIIKQKPEPEDKYVEVEAKIRGTHQHDGSSLANTSLDGLTSTASNTSATTTAVTTPTASSQPTTVTSTATTISSSASPSSTLKGGGGNGQSTARKHTSRLSLSVLNANSTTTAGANTSSSSEPNGDTSVEKIIMGGSSAKRPRLSHKTETIQLDTSQINAANNFLSTSPKSAAAAAAAANAQFVATSAALNLLDKNVINQIANQISSKIMIKLDQINLKVNQISDRLYDLERKLDSVEVAEIQF